MADDIQQEKILGPGASGDPNDPGNVGSGPAVPTPAEMDDDVARAADDTPLTVDEADQTGADGQQDTDEDDEGDLRTR